MNNDKTLVKSTSPKRGSKAELQRRIAIVQMLVAEKLRESEIIDHVRSVYGSEWRVTTNTIKKYIRLAKEDIVKQIHRAGNAILAESLMDMNYLYKKAIDADDYRLALSIRKEKNAVLDIYSIKPLAAGTDTDEDESEIDELMRDVTVNDVTTEGKTR